MKAHSGTTLLELILALTLVLILVGSVSGFLFWETRIYTMISEQHQAVSKFTNTYLVMLKTLQAIKPESLAAQSTSLKIASGTAPANETILFQYVAAQQKLFWQTTPVLENVIASFSYSNQSTGSGWSSTPTGWLTNFATGSVRIELKSLNFNSDSIAFIVHPRGA